MKHSWIKIGNNKKECIICGLVQQHKTISPNKTICVYIDKNTGKETSKVIPCIGTNI